MQHNVKLTRVEHLSDVLFEIFSAFFDAGGLTPIKAKKGENSRKGTPTGDMGSTLVSLSPDRNLSGIC